MRKMLIQGARAALPTLSRSNTHLGQWLRGLIARAHSNTVVVALTAKMARTIWAPLRYGTTFEPRFDFHDLVDSRYQPANDVCEWLREDGLTVNRRSANLPRKMAPRCRPPL